MLKNSLWTSMIRPTGGKDRRRYVPPATVRPFRILSPVRQAKLLLVLSLTMAVSAIGQSPAPEVLSNPAAPGSLQPNWSTASDGNAVLSWIEPSSGGYSLRYAVRRGGTWSEPHTVAANRKFFRHAAEVPEVMMISDHQWLAHWIEMPKEENEAEFVYVSSSSDGLRWTTPAMAHHDRSEVEHGLASMVASGNGEASLIWLEMLKGEDGPAALKRTVVNAAGQIVKEERLDDDVCSCCPTAIARTTKGLVVAYRARTKQDIRDIAVIRLENGQWSKPKIVHADNWNINACPTNAAAISARGDQLAIAWYTGAQDSPRVEVVFSADGGTTFGTAVTVSTGHAFGYASVALAEDGSATVSWLQRVGGDGPTQVLARQVSAAGVAQPVVEVAKGGQSALGYPRVFHSGAETLIAWGGAKLQTARLKK